jgi:hypothetical protein
MTFTNDEVRALRFLKQEFLAKGGRPKTMHDPVTKNGAVMDHLGLDEPQFREMMALFECRGIAKTVGSEDRRGHLHISPGIVGLVRQLDESACRAPENVPLFDGSPCEEHEVPAEFRDGGQPNGPVLTTSYLANNPKWLVSGPYLSKRYPKESKRIKVGREYAYRYDEVLKLRDRKNDIDEQREQ